MELLTTAETLVPRPDSETLIEAVLAHKTDRGAPLSFLDLGTGTGCLLLGLLSEYPAGRGVGVDISSGALVVARLNAQRLGLAHRTQWIESDWGNAVRGMFDVIVSNPPYIAQGDIAALDSEVKDYEPVLALDGGIDGLACYRKIVPQTKRMLMPDGIAAFEIGATQGEAVCAVAKESGMEVLAVRRDLAGLPRCVLAQ